MSSKIIPDETKLAAKRAFVRTTYQAYAATLSAALLTSVISLIVDPTNWLTVTVAVITALASPPLAGLTSYLNISSSGIPEAYVDAAIEQLPVAKSLVAQGYVETESI